MRQAKDELEVLKQSSNALQLPSHLNNNPLQDVIVISNTNTAS
jgi:hypothetical protein